MVLSLHKVLSIVFTYSFALLLYLLYAAGCCGLIVRCDDGGGGTASADWNRELLSAATLDFFDETCKCL